MKLTANRIAPSFLLVWLLCPAISTFAQTPSILRMFSRRSPVEADASKTYELTQADGPWMILAHTFVGEGSRGRAERLALEIRRDHKLPAWIYEEKFDFSGEINPGSPLQVAGGKAATQRRMRYKNEIRYEAHAVLVGEYDSAEHPQIDEDLQRIKTAQCEVFGDEREMAAETDLRNPVTTIKAIHKQLTQRMGKDKMGEMSNAFLTRNPLLPEDYFQSPQVDSFVQKLNEGKPHSLLNCPGKYTVVVRTFAGFNTIVDGKKDKKFLPNGKRLDRCAADAQEMVKALREEGIEAYQYHDRTQSIVTIGSFEDLGYEDQQGRFHYAPPILSIMNEYRAFNIDPNLANHVKGKTTQGVPVKCVAERYPFDIQPTPIAVPKASRRSLYSARFGR